MKEGMSAVKTEEQEPAVASLSRGRAEDRIHDDVSDQTQRERLLMLVRCVMSPMLVASRVSVWAADRLASVQPDCAGDSLQDGGGVVRSDPPQAPRPNGSQALRRRLRAKVPLLLHYLN